MWDFSESFNFYRYNVACSLKYIQLPYEMWRIFFWKYLKKLLEILDCVICIIKYDVEIFKINLNHFNVLK